MTDTLNQMTPFELLCSYQLAKLLGAVAIIGILAIAYGIANYLSKP